MDMKNTAWYADILPQQVCTAALAMVSSTDKMAMKNVALIGHSVDNFIIVAGMMKGFCGIQTSTSKWISVIGFIQSIMRFISTINMCRPEELRHRLCLPSLVCVLPVSQLSYQPMMRRRTREMIQLRFICEQQQLHQVRHVQSGSSGLLSTYLAEYAALDALSNHATDDNVGAVKISNCCNGLSFSFYSTSCDGRNYYEAIISHQMATTRGAAPQSSVGRVDLFAFRGGLWCYRWRISVPVCC